MYMYLPLLDAQLSQYEVSPVFLELVTVLIQDTQPQCCQQSPRCPIAISKYSSTKMCADTNNNYCGEKRKLSPTMKG